MLCEVVTYLLKVVGIFYNWNIISSKKTHRSVMSWWRVTVEIVFMFFYLFYWFVTFLMCWALHWPKVFKFWLSHSVRYIYFFPDLLISFTSRFDKSCASLVNIIQFLFITNPTWLAQWMRYSLSTLFSHPLLWLNEVNRSQTSTPHIPFFRLKFVLVFVFYQYEQYIRWNAIWY